MAEFNPTSLASLLSWHNATNAASISLNGSDEILEIADLSGNGLDFDNIVSSTNRLTVEPAIINGLPAFKNQTSNCGIRWTPTGINVRVIICVWKWYNKSSYDHAFISAGNYHGHSSSGLGSPVFGSLGGRYGYLSELRLNGESKGTTGTQLKCSGTEQLFALLIDASDDTNDHFQGIGYPTTSLGHRAPGIYYGELITLEAGYTTAEIEQVEGYLAHKWGLEADLPAAHPYKAAPPTSPPALTNPAGVASGFSTIDGTLDTSAGNGTLYFAAADTVIPPTIGEIQAGVSSYSYILDPYFDEVSLLLHMDGADGSTTFTDSSSAGRTVTANGDAQIDTSRSKFGGASGLFDGAGDDLSIDNTSNAVIDINADHTIEAWVYLTNTAVNNAIASTRVSTGGMLFYVTDGTERLRALYYGSDGSNIISGGDAFTESNCPIVPANEWAFVSLCRSGNTFYLQVNGGTPVTGSLSGTAENLSPFRVASQGGSVNFNGSIDDLRVTTGVARYTAAYTPPVAAHPSETQQVAVADSGSQSVSAAGEQAVVFDGLDDNTTYYLHYQQKDSSGDDSEVVTSAAVTTDEATGPSITSQPASVSGLAGEAASISVTATPAIGSLSYQWYDAADDSPLAGETGSSLAVVFGPTVKTYYVIVTDSVGSVQSGNATVTGITSFGITAQPQSQSILDGESVAFSVGAGGGVAPLSYQWYENDVLMSGETSSTLTFTVATADDQAGYYCEVTDSDGSVIESAEAVLTVYEALVISTQPSAVSVDASEDAVFSAAASGSGAIRAQWFGPAGAITRVISAPGGSTSVRLETYPSSVGDYYAVFTDDFGQSVQTNAVALTVTVAAPVILLQPQDVNQSARSAYTLEVSASGYGGLLYRWYLDGVEIPGENRSKITVPPGVEASEAYVTVTNPGGTVQSDTATITLYDVGLVNDTTFKPPHPGPYSYAPTRYTVRDFASMVAAVEGQHKEVDDYVFSGRRFTRRDKLLNPKDS